MLYISVPYADKEKAKSQGAIWLPQRNTWAISDHIANLNPFMEWINSSHSCIVRKPYLICASKTNCWKCGKEIPMVALGAKNYYSYEYVNKNDITNPNQHWVKHRKPTLFSSVEEMDDHVKDYLRQHYPWFKLTYSYTLNKSHYSNTCKYCNRLQGDFYHHSDFGAFFPDPFQPVPPWIKIKSFDLDHDYLITASFGGDAYDDLPFPRV